MFHAVNQTVTGAAMVRMSQRRRMIATAIYFLGLCAVTVVVLSSPVKASSAQSATAETSSTRATINKYCVTCHNERAKQGGLALDKINLDHVGEEPEALEKLEKVVRKLRVRSMPPARLPRPDEAGYHALISGLERDLDAAAKARPNPGRPALHRLNRTEYVNAIRDLLALEISADGLLPTDESGFGFDNIADVLSFSPALAERYLSAASKISRLAIGEPALGTALGTVYNLHETVIQDDMMSEDLPFGSRGGMVVRHHFPVDGEYVLQIRLRRPRFGSEEYLISGMGNREQIDLRLNGSRLKLFTIGGPEAMKSEAYRQNADDELNVRVPVTAGTHRISVTFVRRSNPKTEGVGLSRWPAFSTSFAGDTTDMTIASVEVKGPTAVAGLGDSPSRRRIFTCRPTQSQGESACAKRIIATIARRAYRRPVTPADLGTLYGAYDAARPQATFEEAIRQTLQRILVAPEFLFRIESDPRGVAAGSSYRISDLELASRLSFFLWSSIPDDDLIDVAAKGRLHSPLVLEQQVRRMLRDGRAAALVSNFGGQWLHLRNLRLHAPNSRLFPEFDGNLREALRRETELFLESQLREDRSVLDMLSANYSFLNERLARHYGIPGVHGSQYRRVALPADKRAGILGHGSILTATSYAHRTAPTIRGKWLLENLLGVPPPPPPDDVPAFEEDETGQQTTSVRERLEKHRRNPVCATCHSQIDPLGFALENFDALGKWRTEEGGKPIDAASVLPDGTKFSGPVGLREVLLKNKELFVHTLAEKLLTYAVGRGVEYYDMPAVRTIVQDAQSADYRWSSLILGIVRSTPFQMRRAE